MPEKWFLIQKPMLRVCYALAPLAAAAVYLFGWRSLTLMGVAFLAGVLAEAVFTFPRGKPVTSAVFVSCLIFALSLPPTIPFWMAVLGIIAGIALGKMAFGGFGQNVFNPAMVGRCVLYMTFPMEMTNQWIEPLTGGLAGFLHWSPPADALTRATPMVMLGQGMPVPFQDLFLGSTSGSMGETSAAMVLLGGLYIIYKKAAPWRLALSCLLGGIVLSGILFTTGVAGAATPVSNLFAGSFLFGTAFVVTEPISGAKTKAGQWVYGFMIGGLTMILRRYSNFSEGIMFSVLIMNAFVPLIDQSVRQIQARKKA